MKKNSDAAVLAAIAGKTSLLFGALGGRISPQEIGGTLARAKVAAQQQEGRFPAVSSEVIIPIAAGTNGATVAPRRTAQRK